MKNMVLKTFVSSSFVALGALATSPASAMDILARVISSTPVVQQVAVPRQVCNNQQVITQAPKSGAGALLGAVAGGVVGNAIGSGGGRVAATALGLFGGAMLGDNIEGSNSQLQNVQQCNTQTFYENRPAYYNVLYEYQGTQYNTQMANDPGGYVRLQVSPVGALPAPSGQTFQNAPVVQPQAAYPSYQGYQREVVQQPVYIQQQTYVQQPVYVQPAVYPSYYQRPYYGPSYAPYYSPYVAPIGLSLNFGYSRGFGGGHRGHWR